MEVSPRPQSEAPFGPTLRALLAEDERFASGTGRVSWSLLAKELPTVGYDTLRKAVSGSRQPSPDLIEEVAAAIGIEPEHFAEYRLNLARTQFDVQAVGWEQALRNLRRFGALQDPQTNPRVSEHRSSSSRPPSAEAPAS